MKVGARTPSVKKSVSARTKGKVTRTVKGSVNPLYGKKGMGYINNPKKAVYNKVYNKTTFSLFPKTGDGIILGFIKLIIWMYYMIFKYFLVIPIKYLYKKIK